MRVFVLGSYRPVATILIAAASPLRGILGFRLLPVAPLPQVEFPVIMVSASLPGASPETMASSVAPPLERTVGRDAGGHEMTHSQPPGRPRNMHKCTSSRDCNGAAVPAEHPLKRP
uniref:efflux RND transporter permease subunit n=1 Tax=Salmonella enterica TaxID=28901 RepID=UPI00398C4234